jgi:hypothetical protein
MKNWFIVSMFILLLVVGCQSAAKMPGEISLAPGANQVKAPWAGFNDGAWVEYKMLNPTTNTINEFRQSIHQIARGEATVVTAVKQGDKWEKVGMDRVSLFPLPKPAEKPSVSEIVKVGAKTLTCKVADMTYTMGENTTSMKAWMCDDIPGGLAKREMGGRVMWEAVDFGVTGKTPTLAEVTVPKNPWAKFGKGSWVHYKIHNPMEQKEIQQKYSIVDVTKERATIEISYLENGKWEKKSMQEVSLQPVLVPKDQGTPAALDIAGKKVNCTCLEKTIRMGNNATIEKEWLSDEVPGGVVRKEMAGKTVMEVVDFSAVK